MAPDQPLATHIQAEASMFTVQRNTCIFVFGVGVVRGDVQGKELEVEPRGRRNWLLFYFSNTVFAANTNTF
jgi:hypothetical protein